MPKSDLLLDCPSVCARFAGTYKLDSEASLNEKPVWRRQGASQVLFYSKGLHLLIASTLEVAAKGSGSIRSVEPVRINQPWESVKWSTYSRKEKLWTYEPSISSTTLPESTGKVTSLQAPPPNVKPSQKLKNAAARRRASALAASSKSRAPSAAVKDPFNLRRFCQACNTEFDTALAEIKLGEKVGHWSWYFFPTAPWVADGVEKGSTQNQEWCLRDKPPYQLRGDDAARAYLKFEAEGVILREKYMTMMAAVADQLASNIPPTKLVGMLDEPKLRSSLRLFERVSRGGFDADTNRVCRRALTELKEPVDT